MKPRRSKSGTRRLALAAVLAGTSLCAGAANDSGDVPVTRDLHALGEVARAAGVPILLMVSREFCPACVRLEEEILRPMLLSGDYTDEVIMRELKIDEGERVRDFEGRLVSGPEMAKRYDAYLTPTLLFLDDGGREIAPRIRGWRNIDFFAHYVERAIDVASDQLRRRAH